MGRHSPRLSRSQRIARFALGATTVLILMAAVWVMGRGGAAGESQLASATTATSSSSPATTETPATTASSLPTTLTPTTVPTTSLPATTVETSTTNTTLVPLILRSDGLGAVDLGSDTETVIAAVGQRLEAASSDSGWVAARGQFGTCPGTVVRVVRWESLRLFFTDGPTEFAEDVRHFFYYSQSTVETDRVLDLATPEGIGVGSTVEELEEVYGDQLIIESTISFGVNFVVERPGEGLLSGNLTSSSPDGTVTAIAGGFGCGS